MASFFGRFLVGDRRNVTAAFLTLFGILVAHSLLETARDTLFLTRLPASQLPWLYLSIAVLVFFLATAMRASMGMLQQRKTLCVVMAGASCITAGFWFILSRPGIHGLYLLYIWTTILITLAVGQFWILIGDRFHISSAKRAFSIIGAGGLLGATVGSALAGLLTYHTEPQNLVLVAALFQLGVAGLPMLLTSRDAATREASKPAQGVQLEAKASGRLIWEHPYLRILFAIALVTSATLTTVDLTFKTIVSKTVASESLGTFFAAIYTGLNATALMLQLFVASRLFRLLGIGPSLAMLPFLIVISLSFFAATAMLPFLFALKVFDGALRHSLNRTGIELLFVPLRPILRARAKVFVDAVGGRGGQGLAALGVLGALGLGAEPLHLAYGGIGLAVGWMVLLIYIRKPYLDLFREQLREGAREDRTSFPEVDLASLENLMATLNSDDDARVVNALEILNETGRTHLIPALILYHPSTPVVLRAFQILNASPRDDYLSVALRLLDSSEGRVRGQALRAYTLKSKELDVELVWKKLDDPSTPVCANALVALVSGGYLTDQAEIEKYAAAIASRSKWCRVELVRSIRYQISDKFEATLKQLAQSSEPEVQAEIARMVISRPEEKYLSVLLPMLEHRLSREEARRAFLAIGDKAFVYLCESVAEDIPLPIRRHLPRTISRFQTPAAAACLVEQLEHERDEVVCYKMLRGLGRIVANDPDIRLDRQRLEALLKASVLRSVGFFEWQGAVLKVQNDGGSGRGLEMLSNLLSEMSQKYVERCFRILGLLYPMEPFRDIYRGLTRGDPDAYSSSAELLEYLVKEPMKGALSAFVADTTVQEKLRRIPARYRNSPSLDKALHEMLGDRSDILQVLAANLVIERGELETLNFLRKQKFKSSFASQAAAEMLSAQEVSDAG